MHIHRLPEPVSNKLWTGFICAADAADCVRLSGPDSVTLLAGPEETTFNYDHVAGPQTTQEQFFRGLTAQPSSTTVTDPPELRLLCTPSCKRCSKSALCPGAACGCLHVAVNTISTLQQDCTSLPLAYL